MYHLPSTADDSVFQHQMFLCVNGLPEDGYCYWLKHVRELIIYMYKNKLKLVGNIFLHISIARKMNSIKAQTLVIHNHMNLGYI